MVTSWATSPPLGHIELHLGAPRLGQQLLQGLGGLGQRVHRNAAGYLAAVEIVAGQKFLPQGLQVGAALENELPLVRKAAPPVAQDGGAAGGAGGGEGHHVHLHRLVHHHLLAGGDLFHRGDLIPQKSGLLEVQPLGGLLHPAAHGGEDVLFAVADELDGSLHRLVIDLLAYLAAAQRHALADVGVEAGAALADVLGEAAVAAGQQEGILGHFHHLTHREAAGEGADVVGLVVVLLQRRRDAGVVASGYLDVAVALVVLQKDVVFRGVGLDLAGLQHQGLELALADDDVKGEGVLDHLGDLCVVGHALPEVLADTGAQPLGLADVDYFVPLVPDDVDTRQQRQHFCFFVQFGLGHGGAPFRPALLYPAAAPITRRGGKGKRAECSALFVYG